MWNIWLIDECNITSVGCSTGLFCSLSIRSKEWTNRKFLVCRKWWGLSRWHCLLRFERHYSRKTSEEVVDRSEGEDTATFASVGSVLLSTCQRSSPEKQSIVRLRIYSVERLSLSLWSRSMLDGSLSDQSIPWSSAISSDKNEKVVRSSSLRWIQSR